MSFIFDSTEPLLNAARKFPHRIGLLDLSPIIAFIMLELARYIIIELLIRIVL